MHDHLKQQLQESRGAAPGRSFFDIMPNPGSVLYQTARELDFYHETLQYPSFSITLPENDVAGIAIANDERWRYSYLWQIMMRSHQGVALLQGRTTRVGETWNFSSGDMQGRWRHEASVNDPDLEISNFVMDAVNKTSLFRVANELLEERLQRGHDYYDHAPSAASSMYSLSDNKGQELWQKYLGVGFVSGNIVKHIQKSKNRTGLPKVVEFDGLPNWVQLVLKTHSNPVTLLCNGLVSTQAEVDSSADADDDHQNADEHGGESLA